ncbi:MAG: purine-nucleoside phosphorylase [Eubacteriales bacterium]|nr:purine-nucleoside phosphorylase [Eubacteriales bacterium]
MKYSDIEMAVDYIRGKIRISPKIAIILGSGLGSFADHIEEQTIVPYNEIPNFPSSSVEGHVGKIIFGKLQGKYIIAFSGRVHYYEGYSMDKLAMPSVVAKLLGCEKIIITNAAGGINEEFSPGELMLIKDHIKLCPDNPMRGSNYREFGSIFKDMSNVYTKSLREIAKDEAYGLDLTLHEGVYAYMTGPCYETPAEIRMLKLLGADAVGMSTVPEAIMAVNCGLDVLGISYITNMATGISGVSLSHSEVLEAGKYINKAFTTLVTNIIDRL